MWIFFSLRLVCSAWTDIRQWEPHYTAMISFSSPVFFWVELFAFSRAGTLLPIHTIHFSLWFWGVSVLSCFSLLPGEKTCSAIGACYNGEKKKKCSTPNSLLLPTIRKTSLRKPEKKNKRRRKEKKAARKERKKNNEQPSTWGDPSPNELRSACGNGGENSVTSTATKFLARLD